ncbi:MAG: cation-transporting P-type ATPase [Lutibacter sp.]
MSVSNFNIKGLSQKEVLLAREKYGKNTLNFKQESGFLTSLKSLLKDPIIILLVAASSIYLISGATGDGIFLARLHIYLPPFAKFFQFEKLNST